MEHCPDETTELFVDYYTGSYAPRSKAVHKEESQSPHSVGTTAIQTLVALFPSLPYTNSSATAISQSPPSQAPGDSHSGDTNSYQPPPPPHYETPRPRTAFSSFVDQPDKLVVLLEACLKHGNLVGQDEADVYTALLEMCLHFAQEKKYDEHDDWYTRAKKLIEDKNVLDRFSVRRPLLRCLQVPIDPSSILLLSHLSHFQEGTTLVREKQGLRFDIFRSYTSAKDTAGAIRALRKYGGSEPQLYPAALAYFTSSLDILKEAGDEFEAVLKKIDEEKLMAPLQVVQTLSANDVATMGLVKKYLSNTIEKERKEIMNVCRHSWFGKAFTDREQNRSLIESYRTESQAKRKELEELGNKPVVFQAIRCSACGRNLDLPTVHFLCKHSFHQRCLNQGNEDAECPVCAPQNATIRAIRRGQ